MDTDPEPVIILSKKRDKASPRKIAFLILVKYFKERKSLKVTLNYYFKDYKLSALNRRFIFNIVKGTVRYYLKIDFILSLFSDKNIKDIDFKVLNILRMGIFQLMYMDKVPDYSTVNESVELAKKNVSISSSKFVNAILRRVSSTPDTGLFIEGEIKRLIEDEIDRISISYSYPRWLVKYWTTWYGKEKCILICQSLNENPHTYLRFNRNKIAREDLLGELGIETADSELCNSSSKKSRKFTPDYIKVENDNFKIFQENILEDAIEVSSVQDIAKTNAYNKGLISIQDISSRIAVKYFLEPSKGEKILDVCAAPGGKTTYIAELVGDKGEVVSVDISRKRIGLLKDNLGRLNIKNVEVIEADAAKKDFLERSKSAIFNRNYKKKIKSVDCAGYFDSILIDAPCSAFGTISKDPDVKYSKTMNDIIRLSELSYRMIVNCGRYLKTGGKLVYYTCTLSPLENQQVIDKLLKEFNGKYTAQKPAIPDILMSILKSKKDNTCRDSKEETCLEIMPYYFGSEGGFVCSLIKKI